MKYNINQWLLVTLTNQSLIHDQDEQNVKQHSQLKVEYHENVK